jgi:hypothetical protein
VSWSLQLGGRRRGGPGARCSAAPDEPRRGADPPAMMSAMEGGVAEFRRVGEMGVIRVKSEVQHIIRRTRQIGDRTQHGTEQCDRSDRTMLIGLTAA